MSHELKRKDMQVKELQARLDTGDGCKYTSIDNAEYKKCKKSVCHIAMEILRLHLFCKSQLYMLYTYLVDVFISTQVLNLF